MCYIGIVIGMRSEKNRIGGKGKHPVLAWTELRRVHIHTGAAVIKMHELANLAQLHSLV